MNSKSDVEVKIGEAGQQIAILLTALMRTIQEAEAKVAEEAGGSIQRLRDPFVGKGAVAAHLDRDVSTIERYMTLHRNPLPHYRIGGKVMFKISEVDVWMEQYRFPKKDKPKS